MQRGVAELTSTLYSEKIRASACLTPYNEGLNGVLGFTVNG